MNARPEPVREYSVKTGFTKVDPGKLLVIKAEKHWVRILGYSLFYYSQGYSAVFLKIWDNPFVWFFNLLIDSTITSLVAGRDSSGSIL